MAPDPEKVVRVVIASVCVDICMISVAIGEFSLQIAKSCIRPYVRRGSEEPEAKLHEEQDAAYPYEARLQDYIVEDLSAQDEDAAYQRELLKDVVEDLGHEQDEVAGHQSKVDLQFDKVTIADKDFKEGSAKNVASEDIFDETTSLGGWQFDFPFE
jgi:hypothetical protein